MDDQATDPVAEAPQPPIEGSKPEIVEKGKQEAQDQKQSNEVEEGKEEKLFEDSFGNKLTADQLYETYNKIIPNYTRVTQELAELKKAQQVSSQQSEDSIRENKLLKDVPPDVKEAIVQIVKPLIDAENRKRDEEMTQKEKDQAALKELEDLEKRYPGGDGKPKFDRQKVISKMLEPGNRIFDPETIYHKLNEKELTDNLIKQALRQQQGGRRSEITGGQVSSKPESKSPKTFAEASRALLNRISQGE